jgi:hypothetical protein
VLATAKVSVLKKHQVGPQPRVRAGRLVVKPVVVLRAKFLDGLEVRSGGGRGRVVLDSQQRVRRVSVVYQVCRADRLLRSLLPDAFRPLHRSELSRSRYVALAESKLVLGFVELHDDTFRHEPTALICFTRFWNLGSHGWELSLSQNCLRLVSRIFRRLLIKVGRPECVGLGRRRRRLKRLLGAHEVDIDVRV